MRILTALSMITPYKKDGSVDIDTALKYVDFYFENGIAKEIRLQEGWYGG